MGCVLKKGKKVVLIFIECGMWFWKGGDDVRILVWK